MSSQFQNLFDNVCRCFGHTPSNGSGRDGGGDDAASVMHGTGAHSNVATTPSRQPISQANSQSSSGRRRTNRLGLKDREYDELFEKKNLQQQQQQQQNHQRNGGSATTPQHHKSSYPPRPEVDKETAQAVAQAKLAANPARYRTKRKRSAQTREEIFRTKDDRRAAAAAGGRRGSQQVSGSSNSPGGCGVVSSSGGGGRRQSAGTSSALPQTDFSRLLNPSLALCFATPVRGTEEEPDEQDLRSVDNSDTNTLNTCEDTITSTLYFDSKYAHIQESRPPMPLFSQFKVGQADDEIRTIMATDSHSSLRMIKLMQQQQQQQQLHHRPRNERTDRDGNVMKVPEDDTSSSEEDLVGDGSRRLGGTQRKDSGIIANDADEEMQDAVPDVKAVSSSTDSSRLSSVPHHA
jgi:hypothetical protein